MASQDHEIGLESEDDASSFHPSRRSAIDATEPRTKATRRPSRTVESCGLVACVVLPTEIEGAATASGQGQAEMLYLPSLLILSAR